MNKKLFFMGMLAVLLALGFALAGCDSDTSAKDEYHLKWGIVHIGYSQIESTIDAQEWDIADSDTDWALATGGTADSIYDYCMNDIPQAAWGDSGDLDGSFDDCINSSKNGTPAPDGLKAAAKAQKGAVPLAGVFAGGYSSTVLFYITKN